MAPDPAESGKMRKVIRSVSNDDAPLVVQKGGGAFLYKNEDSSTENQDSSTENEDSSTENEDSSTENQDSSTENQDSSTENQDSSTENEDSSMILQSKMMILLLKNDDFAGLPDLGLKTIADDHFEGMKKVRKAFLISAQKDWSIKIIPSTT